MGVQKRETMTRPSRASPPLSLSRPSYFVYSLRHVSFEFPAVWDLWDVRKFVPGLRFNAVSFCWLSAANMGIAPGILCTGSVQYILRQYPALSSLCSLLTVLSCSFLRHFGPTADDLMSMDYSFDLLIYGIFTLLVTTATFWRGTWKALQRRDGRQGAVKVLLLSSGVHLLRELLIIKVRAPSPRVDTFFFFEKSSLPLSGR